MSAIAIWSSSLLVLQATQTARDALAEMARAAPTEWVVVSRAGGQYVYAYPWRELADRLAAAPADLTLERVLNLHEYTATPSGIARPDDTATEWGSGAGRWVHVSSAGVPIAVGELRHTASALPPPDDSAAAQPAPPARSPKPRSAPPVAPAMPPATPAERATNAAAQNDEGRSPVRHPAIEADAALTPGAQVTLTVDLLREVAAHTQGNALTLDEQAPDWDALEISVVLQSEAIDLPAPVGTVTVRRNAASTPARFAATVRAGASGPVTVMATFLIGTRFCGSASRTFDGASATQGAMQAKATASKPDLTIHISRLDKREPGRLRWLCVPDRVAGLPAQLEADIDLGTDPGALCAALLAGFAQLPAGRHQAELDGFGSHLWRLAPPMMQQVYWALHDALKRPLVIQFISDDPHLPWELMRPARPDESEIHAALTRRHDVARWLKRWDGRLQDHIDAGEVVSIAPHYATLSLKLPRAEAEADALVALLGARKVAGTRQQVLALLEQPPATPIAVMHFAGHGVFSAQAASRSRIALEDADLSAQEVDRPEVQLGRACGPLVFLNACEVGGSGAVFGEVGGWADALLARQFRGFIAPLWAVDDADASTFALAVLEAVCTRGEPIAQALRRVRDAHADVSPTFAAYLYFGDATARVARS